MSAVVRSGRLAFFLIIIWVVLAWTTHISATNDAVIRDELCKQPQVTEEFKRQHCNYVTPRQD